MASRAACSRCFLTLPVDDGTAYCPRCGLKVGESAGDSLRIQAGAATVEVGERLASGDVANLYHCLVVNGERQGTRGVFKIAREAEGNRHVAREADVLRRLHEADSSGKLGAFLPQVVGSVLYASGSDPAQRGNVLAYHEGVRTPGELYSLVEVREAYPKGIDARDMAWMWRRVLTVLALVHEAGVVHTAVTPEHVMIEPKEHKLVVVGWCGAVAVGQVKPLATVRSREWGDGELRASAQEDVRLAAKTMRYVMGDEVEPAIARHLDRAAESSPGAGRLLEDFDRLIEALWGRREFRVFEMPKRS